MGSNRGIEILKSLATPESLADLIAHRYGLANVHCQLIKSTMRDTYLVRQSRHSTDKAREHSMRSMLKSN